MSSEKLVGLELLSDLHNLRDSVNAVIGRVYRELKIDSDEAKRGLEALHAVENGCEPTFSAIARAMGINHGTASRSPAIRRVVESYKVDRSVSKEVGDDFKWHQ